MDEFVKVVQCLSFIQSISSFIVNIFLCLDFFLCCIPLELKRQPSKCQNFEVQSHSLFPRCLRLETAITDSHPRLATGGWLDLTGQAFHLLDYSPFSGRTIPSCRVHYNIRNSIVKELMYAARRRQKSVRGKFQLGKLRIGQQFQLFDNSLGQFPQGSFIRHQVALHEPQFVDKPQPGAGVVEHHQHEFFMVKVHGHPSLSDRRWDCTPGHRTSP